MIHPFMPPDKIKDGEEYKFLAEHFRVGGVWNHYGELHAAKTVDCMGEEYFWWSIENWDGHRWEQIGELLFNVLRENINESGFNVGEEDL